MCWQKIKEFLASFLWLTNSHPYNDHNFDFPDDKSFKMSYYMEHNRQQGFTLLTASTASEDVQNSQVSSTTSPVNRIPRTPEHYEMIDQIGKGSKIN